MNKREMAKQFRAVADKPWFALQPEDYEAAAAALEREAEREEKERPKVTLAEMVRECSRDIDCEHNTSKLLAAADTLERLRVEGGKFIARHDENCTIPCGCVACVLLRSLGCEATP